MSAAPALILQEQTLQERWEDDVKYDAQIYGPSLEDRKYDEVYYGKQRPNQPEEW